MISVSDTRLRWAATLLVGVALLGGVAAAPTSAASPDVTFVESAIETDTTWTPADGPYPFVQPGVDYADGEAYCETAMIPDGNAFPAEGRNRTR